MRVIGFPLRRMAKVCPQTSISFLYARLGPNTALYIGYNDLLFDGIDPPDSTRAQELSLRGHNY